MSAEAAFTRTWHVGKYTATLSSPPLAPGRVVSVVIEWSPSKPSNLTASEWDEYHAGRDAALRDMAVEIGVNVAVVDL
jgi:hypothetical protein